MRMACFCILLASFGLSGQPYGNSAPYFTEPASAPSIQKLKSALRAISKADLPVDLLSQNLADSMLPLVVRGHEPTVPEVTDFAREITRALAGRALSDEQVVALQECLVGMLRGTGISNFALAQHLQETLTALSIDDTQTDLIIRRFLDIGEAVRGLDDQRVHPRASK
jgi:hypothetical protein